MVKPVVTIREYDPSEIDEISMILAPAFEDKVMVVIGDREKAMRIIPTIIRSIEGTIFVAESGKEQNASDTEYSEGKRERVREQEKEKTEKQGQEGKLIGAIIISVDEFKITIPIVLRCLKVLGFRGSWHAFRMVSNYLKSEPEKIKGEGRLEAVGVYHEHCGRGIGTRLVSRGEEYLVEQGLEYYGLGVKVGNPAHQLYADLGFRDIVRYHNSMDEWIYMRKLLGKDPWTGKCCGSREGVVEGTGGIQNTGNYQKG